MKLVTFRVPESLGSSTRIGALHGDDLIVDLNAADDSIPPDMIKFLSEGSNSRKAASKVLASVKPGDAVCYALADVDLLAPVPRPNSIRDTISFENHMKNFEKRTGRPIPDYWYQSPVYYKGNPCSVVGTGADVYWPSYTEKFDYELEYGIVIGKQGVNISADDAGDYIGGYTIFNDFSARDVIQKEVSVFLGPAKAKDMDTGNAIGPCLVTPDEIGSRDLRMVARINGEVWSEGQSSDMYWSFADIIAHVSKDETLYPGDFIGSGTVANGCGDELDRWIQPGDTVELEVEGIGVLRNRIVRRERSTG